MAAHPHANRVFVPRRRVASSGSRCPYASLLPTIALLQERRRKKNRMYAKTSRERKNARLAETEESKKEAEEKDQKIREMQEKMKAMERQLEEAQSAKEGKGDAKDEPSDGKK